MGKLCKKCRKVMKIPEASHCSDECLLSDIKKSKSLNKEHKGVEAWGENSDPWI